MAADWVIKLFNTSKGFYEFGLYNHCKYLIKLIASKYIMWAKTPA